MVNMEHERSDLEPLVRVRRCPPVGGLGPDDPTPQTVSHTPTIAAEQADSRFSDWFVRHRSTFNVWFFGAISGYANVVAREHKRFAFNGLEVGTILEIGAGTGANFSFVPANSTLLALEPNVAMRDRLRRRAAEAATELELLTAPAEAIPLPDDSVDTVICTLVLCTVHDPEATIKEVKRVLRRGGTFRFVEHVASRPASPRRWLQRALTRPWVWLFEGCQLCRDTADLIDAGGFQTVRIEQRRFRRSLFVPVNKAICGIATV
jgi:SAM-dependent methyltransferase